MSIETRKKAVAALVEAVYEVLQGRQFVIPSGQAPGARHFLGDLCPGVALMAHRLPSDAQTHLHKLVLHISRPFVLEVELLPPAVNEPPVAPASDPDPGAGAPPPEAAPAKKHAAKKA